MTLATHLHVVGALLLLLGISHAFFDRYFGWEQELKGVSLLTRRIFYVHTFFIGLGVVMAGAGSLFYAADLLRPGTLSRAFLGGMAAFWFCRLLAQFLAYDAAIWRDNRFRTFVHAAFAVFWCYVTATYGVAFITVWD
ncbi:MAG: hypothetical protein ABSB60_18705 [Terracidiphilus sp.]|jgi:hypothetical protein